MSHDQIGRFPSTATTLLVGPRSAGGRGSLTIEEAGGRASLPLPFGHSPTSSLARFTPTSSPVSVPAPGQMRVQDRTQGAQPGPLDRNGQPAPGHALPAYGEDKPGEEGRALGPVPPPRHSRFSYTTVHTENAWNILQVAAREQQSKGAPTMRCLDRKGPGKGRRIDRPVKHLMR